MLVLEQCACNISANEEVSGSCEIAGSIPAIESIPGIHAHTMMDAIPPLSPFLVPFEVISINIHLYIYIYI